MNSIKTVENTGSEIEIGNDKSNFISDLSNLLQLYLKLFLSIKFDQKYCINSNEGTYYD